MAPYSWSHPSPLSRSGPEEALTDQLHGAEHTITKVNHNYYLLRWKSRKKYIKIYKKYTRKLATRKFKSNSEIELLISPTHSFSFFFLAIFS